MQNHPSDDDREFLACLAEARRLVRAGLGDERVLAYIRRWEPVAREIVARSVRQAREHVEVA